MRFVKSKTRYIVALGLVAGATVLSAQMLPTQDEGSQILPSDICSASITDDPASATPDMASMSGMEGMSTEAEAHDHPARPVDPSLPIPALTHLVFPDAMDGYNLQVLPRNFKFTPASINRDVVPNEGHAHVYVNGVKIARIYGQWYHLPASALSPGVNAVSVTLNANDHSTWASPTGELIVSTVPVILSDIGE